MRSLQEQRRLEGSFSSFFHPLPRKTLRAQRTDERRGEREESKKGIEGAREEERQR